MNNRPEDGADALAMALTPELDITSAVYDPTTLTVLLKLNRAPFPEELAELQQMVGEVNAAGSLRHS